MSCKTFKTVSVLALSGILLVSALTNPSQAMNDDNNPPPKPTIARKVTPEQIQAIRDCSAANGWTATQIAGRVGIRDDVARTRAMLRTPMMTSTTSQEISNESDASDYSTEAE